MQGWISLHRQIQKHWLYIEKRQFSRFEAWIDLLLMVNHQDNKFLLGNELIEVKRGSKVTSIRQLCDRWRWSNTKVVKFLELLRDDGMLNFESDKKKTVITIENYDKFQNQNDTKTSQEIHEDDTETSQEHTNNNVNNYNNLLLLSISKADFPKFYDWLEEKNLEVNLDNEEAYYLKYLHERSNHYYKTKGKEHPDTVDAIKAFEERKAISSQEIVLKAQSI